VGGDRAPTITSLKRVGDLQPMIITNDQVDGHTSGAEAGSDRILQNKKMMQNISKQRGNGKAVGDD